MGDLSDHFDLEEYACQGEDCCSHTAAPDERLVEAFEQFRVIVGRPVVLSSAFRCLTHNRRIGSKDSSEHVKGRAGDVETLDGMTVEEQAAAAEKVPAFRDGGIGLYDWGTHLDVRRGRYPARWDYRSSAA